MDTDDSITVVEIYIIQALEHLLVLWNSRFLLALRPFLQSLQCLLFLIDKSDHFETLLGNVFKSMPVQIIIITIVILVPFKKLNTCVKLLMADFSTTVHKRQKCHSYRRKVPGWHLCTCLRIFQHTNWISKDTLQQQMAITNKWSSIIDQ